MTADQSIVFAILGGVLLLFASGRVRHDVVALIALALVAFSGTVPQQDLFAGFGHPAVITVMAVLIISAALNRAGVVDLAAKQFGPYTKNPIAHVLVLTGAVAVLSAFINNVGALALMMPVAIATAAEHDRNPAILLMPLSFAAILGGMTTQIGTPPNIIIAGIRGDAMGAPFGMFDFTPVGLTVAAVGVLFVALVGWRLLPAQRQQANAQREIFTVGGYLTELRVPGESPLAGRPMREATLFFEHGASVFGIQRGDEAGGQRLPAVGYRILSRGDILLVRASPETLAKIIAAYKLTVVSEPKERKGLSLDREIEWKDASLLEAVLSPSSPLIGRPARVVDRVFGRNVTLLALARQGAPIVGRLREQTFKSGDVALLQGESTALSEIVERFSLLPLAERGLNLGRRTRPWRAIAVFGLAVALAASGTVSIAVAFILAILIYIAMGDLPMRELYQGVDWSVIVLLGAMFPLGFALENTGGTTLIAETIVAGADSVGAPAWAVMVLLLIATMALTDVINNAATALLMAPLAVSVAETLSVNPDAFLMTVAIGASAAFLTPIGHQCNTLVMGPGGYKFTDYWRMGLPLDVLIVLVATPMILLVWGL